MDVTYAAQDLPDQSIPLVLFDLDGTLVDPAGGITGGIRHALAHAGLPLPEPETLTAMIGPKLADALVSVAGVPESRVAEVIAAYREWYAEKGMAMSRLYPGIRELLAELSADGVVLGVATQKPAPLALKLLTQHGLDEVFAVISGSHADETLMPGEPGYRSGKSEIIAAALTDVAARHAGAEQSLAAVMVGDRYQDVNGAASNGLDCVGVGWGFAREGELAAAGAAAIVETAAELGTALAAYRAEQGAARGAL